MLPLVPPQVVGFVEDVPEITGDGFTSVTGPARVFEIHPAKVTVKLVKVPAVIPVSVTAPPLAVCVTAVCATPPLL